MIVLNVRDLTDLLFILKDLWSPLHWAAKLNYIQSAKVLVENGACLNCVNAVSNRILIICNNDLGEEGLIEYNNGKSTRVGNFFHPRVRF